MESAYFLRNLAFMDSGTGVCVPNPWNFCNLSSLSFWNKIRNLTLESGDLEIFSFFVFIIFQTKHFSISFLICLFFH